MKIFLALALVLSVLVVLSSATCGFDKLKLNAKTKSKVCIKDGQIFSIGTEWRTPNCEKCTCDSSGLQCCTAMQPVGYDKETCEAIFDQENCIYNVVRKDDPSKECTGEITYIG